MPNLYIRIRFLKRIILVFLFLVAEYIFCIIEFVDLIENGVERSPFFVTFLRVIRINILNAFLKKNITFEIFNLGATFAYFDKIFSKPTL